MPPGLLIHQLLLLPHKAVCWSMSPSFEVGYLPQTMPAEVSISLSQPDNCSRYYKRAPSPPYSLPGHQTVQDLCQDAQTLLGRRTRMPCAGAYTESHSKSYMGSLTYFIPCWKTEFLRVLQMIKSAHCTTTMLTKKAVWQVNSTIFLCS